VTDVKPLAFFTAPAVSVVLVEVEGVVGDPSIPTGNAGIITTLTSSLDTGGSSTATGPIPGAPASESCFPIRHCTWGPPRHFEGANYLLADGHVKYYQPSQVSPGWTAATSVSAQIFHGAQGALFSGTGARAITMSAR